MAYLRHHGFPSPLLDWTRSFYIAAFFAYRNCEQPTQNVAIYAFVEYGARGKLSRSDKARICGLGPNIKTDKRHFLQQSEYTICKKHVDGMHGEFVYCSHEEVVARKEKDQDILTKFTMPAAERIKVIQRLRAMNITSYSLFGGEDDLLRDLANQELE